MNIDLKKKREKRNSIFRWFIYYIVMFVSYIYMTTVNTGIPMPLLLIPLSLAVSMFEEPFDSAVTGLVAGMLLDSAEGTLIGLNGIIMLWCCLITSLLFMFVMRRHIVNILMITLIVTVIQGSLHYLFYYSIWGYNDGWNIVLKEFLPVIAMTNIFTVFFYYMVKHLDRKMGVIRENYIEEKTDDIVRE